MLNTSQETLLERLDEANINGEEDDDNDMTNT
jgi:hypothetical protein